MADNRLCFDISQHSHLPVVDIFILVGESSSSYALSSNSSSLHRNGLIKFKDVKFPIKMLKEKCAIICFLFEDLLFNDNLGNWNH